MSLILDEMANFGEAWEGLVSIISDGGCVGISAWPVLQSMAQVRNFWGNEAASAIWEMAARPEGPWVTFEPEGDEEAPDEQ